ncbi:shikimate dehydrogenase [Evansella cellulosilytica]|uniref:Shikimate dehydrogenase (NADP(+)) n=1 Tax=Evansella cellulosilytica (strain ATCC 21833 / DSM 2522 / FERM P-1141 / JCM 9156 / N-4) TaxID=649639 RepID=E6TW08_EVAC2|nr:shikimate dehydrogenase [Evansella cellulosilytica]ADU29831.1 shikimate 5-dehydrogenase [Evansella cellulosilytica DSM 2522]
MKQIIGVIGDPIGHSLSPHMHNAAYRELGINMEYHAFHVKREQLENALKGVRGLGIKGLNVTIPHKVNVLPYLDEVDELARHLGAVNTIVNEDGKLIGFNTDGEGYLQSLYEFIQGDLQTKRVLMIGAGGASRAVTLTIANSGVKEIIVTNRTAEKGEELVKDCKKFCPSSFMSLEEVEKNLERFDVVINTTSIGMAPHLNKLPISLDKVKSDTIVSDLIYTPFKTKFLIEAEKKGCRVLNGLDMFVYQGALAFKRWTGINAPTQVMREAVLQQLEGGKKC